MRLGLCADLSGQTAPHICQDLFPLKLKKPWLNLKIIVQLTTPLKMCNTGCYHAYLQPKPFVGFEAQDDLLWTIKMEQNPTKQINVVPTQAA